MEPVFIQAYFKTPITYENPVFNDGKLLNELLTESYGYGGYECTTHIKKEYLEIKVASKKPIEMVKRFYEKYQDNIEILFFRYIHDYTKQHINCMFEGDIFEAAAKEGRMCRYGFDNIRFYTDHPFEHPKVIHLKKDLYWIRNIHGSYLTANKYDFDYNIYDVLHAEWDVNKDFVSKDLELLSRIQEVASSIEYYYDHRLVGYSITEQEYCSRGLIEPSDRYGLNPLADFVFDGWHNCVDKYYRKYINDRKEAEKQEYLRKQKLKFRNSDTPF